MIGMQLGCGLFSSGGTSGIGLAEAEFPIGSVARLVDPFVDYTGREKVDTFTKMPNGNWSSGSQHNEYFTSFEKLNFKRPVRIVMYGAVEIWPNDKRALVAKPTELSDIMIPKQPPVMLPDANDAAAEAAPWSPPAPHYDAPKPRVMDTPAFAAPRTPAPVAEKSNTGMWVMAALAFFFLR